MLRVLAEGLESGGLAGFGFNPRAVLAPLPRAPQWLNGSVFENHLALMAQIFSPERPHEARATPLVYQGASDDLRSPTDDIAGHRIDEQIDFSGEFGVILDEVPMGTSADNAGAHIKLMVLLNDVSLRAYTGPEMSGGFGFINAKPATAFAPVAVTPDELGPAWSRFRVHLSIQIALNGHWFGHPNGSAMDFGFDELIAHCARTRRLSAGTIIGAGTVSNADRSVGSACIAERRAIEASDDGTPSTSFLAFGDRVRMLVEDDEERSIFGSIDQICQPALV